MRCYRVAGVGVALNVVRQLSLEEKRGATIPVPLDYILERVLRGEAIHNHVIPIDDKRCVARIISILNDPTALDVIGTPQPQVIADDSG